MPEQRESEARKRIGSEIESLSKRSQLRVLNRPRGTDLCSNDYLGLASDPRLKLAVLEAVARAEKIGATGSRLHFLATRTAYPKIMSLSRLLNHAAKRS